MRQFIFYCRVCGTQLETTEWSPTGAFSLVTGRPEYTKFHKCPNSQPEPLHTLMREDGYMMIDRTVISVSCEEL